MCAIRIWARETFCCSLLTKSGIPSIDYAVNPYVGCQHGCAYCYAVFMKRFSHHREPWGTFVDVRLNAALVLAEQLKHAKPGVVSLSTVTDPYQPLERRYQLTRACLQALAKYPAFAVSILTKSALVLRDLDVLTSMSNDLEVGFTITALEEDLRRCLEPRAAPVVARLKALRTLAEAGLKTRVVCGPLLPFLSDDESQIQALFYRLREARVGRVMVDTLNWRPGVRSRLLPLLAKHYPDLVEDYRWLEENRVLYLNDLRRKVERAAKKWGLPTELIWDSVYRRPGLRAKPASAVAISTM